jgi:hypothetical protein
MIPRRGMLFPVIVFLKQAVELRQIAVFALHFCQRLLAAGTSYRIDDLVLEYSGEPGS